ncbi:hypothetical protein GCM10028798_04520 [Humibacter antri]
MTEFEWRRLRRWPDAEADNLYASDAADRLIVDTAASTLGETPPDEVVVVGDTYGALTLAAADLLRGASGVGGDGAGADRAGASGAGADNAGANGAGGDRVGGDGAGDDRAGADGASGDGAVSGGAQARGATGSGDAVMATDVEATRPAGAGGHPEGRIRVHQDALLSERALAANAERLGRPDCYRSCGLDAELVGGARVVLMRLPKSLDELDDVARMLATHLDPAAIVFAGGMQKHLTPTMNEVLARHFDRIDVGLGRGKARVLTITGPRPDQDAPAEWPHQEFHADIAPGLRVCAHGGAFAGTRIDIGTRFLLEHLDEAVPSARTAVDLACGTGSLATTLALRRPEAHVIASDQSAAAVASARATAEANGVGDRVEARRENAGEGIPDGWADLVLLNPPFHNGAALDLRVGRMLVAAAARMLAPGGELWTVYNSHLDYRPALRGLVGPTRQVDRNRKFTITASTRG